MDNVTRLLSQLVAIPSVNPMGRALEGPEYLETRIGDFLEDHFRSLGVDYTRTEVAPGRDNLIAIFESRRGGRTLLWDAHQDTVPTDGMTIPPFEPRVEGGRLYGRGACDIKSGLAAMLEAFSRLVQDRPESAATVVLACTVDEEFTHKGSSRLADVIANPETFPDIPHGARPDLGIVAEPTMLNIVPTHKGAVRWKLHMKGVACHSSTPHRGVNAIYRMAPVLAALEEYAAGLAASTPDPHLGPPSLSVGRIEGGQSVNVVPDWCEIEIDRRVIPGELPDDCPGRVMDFLKGRLDPAIFADLSASPPWVRMPALVPRVPDDWMATVGESIRGVTGRTPDVSGVPYGTDAGPLSQSGLPCLVIGPGDIAQAHTKDEWIELDQVRAASEIYYRLALAFG